MRLPIKMSVKDTFKHMTIKKTTVWVLMMIIAIGSIVIGNKVVTGQTPMFGGIDSGAAKAEVLTAKKSIEKEQSLGGQTLFSTEIIEFTCEVKGGPYKGKTIAAKQSLSEAYGSSQAIKHVEAGDRVMVFQVYPNEGAAYWEFMEYDRFGTIAWLAGIFALLTLIIGRWKGVNTLLSLTFTFMFIFMVFVPSVINGYNPYITSAITCIYTIIMTLVLLNGISQKTIATIIGCTAGAVVAATVTAIMSLALNLTGYVDEHSIYLSMMNEQNPIDLTAIIFAAIIIGALGAIMDVAMDISSALYEICGHVPNITFGKLFVSGMQIGRDIMGTMANTLVLAYVGGSLTGIMLLLVYTGSLGELLNREVIITELLQALTGSLAILLTVPFTVVTCGFIYLKQNKNK